MARFKSVTLEVYNLDKSMDMLALKRVLHTSCLTYSLDKILIKSYSKMLAHGEKEAISRCEADGRLNKKKLGRNLREH